MSGNRGTMHPAKEWPSRWFFFDRSNQSDAMQIIDLLHDIRIILMVIAVFVILGV